MYKVRKTFEIAGAHKLELDYNSKCQNLHGHNWIVTIEIATQTLDNSGMVVDFVKLKSQIIQPIMERFDHRNINEQLPGINPTVENLAEIIHMIVSGKLEDNLRCTSVEIQESRDNVGIYEEEPRW